MPGKIVAVPQRAHACEGQPPTGSYPKGTQWQCSECHQTWVLVYGAQYNEPYEVWRKMTLKNANGEDRF